MQVTKGEYVQDLKFCQGQGWDEYDVEPDEAFRILGYDVRLEC